MKRYNLTLFSDQWSGRNQQVDLQFNPLSTSKANWGSFVCINPQTNWVSNKIIDWNKTADSHDINNDNTISNLNLLIL